MFEITELTNILVQAETHLGVALKQLDANGYQILLVVDSVGKLQGILTDGDVRRHLISNGTLNVAVTDVMNLEYTMLPLSNKSEAYNLVRTTKLNHVPLVNSNAQVQSLVVGFDKVRARDELFIIMAGGKGTRLRPHTEHCPKPMLEVNGKPMLEHIIERAKSEGFTDFLLSVNYKGHMIEDYFHDGSSFGIHIDYIREVEPLGTAGSLSLINTKINKPVVVTNGDVMTDVKYGEVLDFHIEHRAEATMAVKLHEWEHPFGVIELNGVEITGFTEKPVLKSHVNAGIYVVEPRALETLEYNTKIDMPELFENIRGLKHRIVAYPMHEPWLDVGRPNDLEKIRANKSL